MSTKSSDAVKPKMVSLAEKIIEPIFADMLH